MEKQIKDFFILVKKGKLHAWPQFANIWVTHIDSSYLYIENNMVDVTELKHYLY